MKFFGQGEVVSEDHFGANCLILQIHRVKSMAYIHTYVYIYMGVSLNGGTQQPWVFLLKMIILWCFGGTTIYRKHPYK